MKKFLLCVSFVIFLLLSCDDGINSNISNEFFINKIYPENGNPRQIILITGQGFGRYENNLEVAIGNEVALFWLICDTLIRVQVPVLDTGYYEVSITKNNKTHTAKQKFHIISNKIKWDTVDILDLSHETLSIGDTLCVYIANYGVAENNLSYSIAEYVKNCISYSDTIIKFLITPDIPNGRHFVEIRFYDHNRTLMKVRSSMRFTVMNSDISFSKIQMWFRNFIMKVNTQSSSGNNVDTLLRSYIQEIDTTISPFKPITDNSEKNNINISWHDNPQAWGYIKFVINFKDSTLTNISFSHYYLNIVEKVLISNKFNFSIEKIFIQSTNSNQYEAYIYGLDLTKINYGLINIFELSYSPFPPYSNETTTDTFLSITDSSSIKIVLTK